MIRLAPVYFTGHMDRTVDFVTALRSPGAWPMPGLPMRRSWMKTFGRILRATGLDGTLVQL